MHILWFRRDLRLEDNEIVSNAATNNAEVLPCFIIDPWFYQQAEVGTSRVKFLFESLENLDDNLKALCSKLYLFEGNSISVLQELTSQLLKLGKRPKLFFNRDVQVQYGIERDRQIVDFYHQHNLSYHQGLNNFLQTNGERTDGWMDEYYNYLRSHLSPHLTFGTISVRQVYQRTKERAAELASNSKAQFSLKAFRDRLRWHDSFTQRLYNYPELAHTNRYREFDQYYSPAELNEEKQELFAAWIDGQTGFPLVDASMRQLKTMGWMNFRMRAMCATFLCINCGISWHHGAEHYMRQLVDGDLAIDNWQWQMQAGVTNPLSDIFRIYNPNKNLEEKDGDLKFIYHWVEELRGYSLIEVLNGAYLNESPYPAPILDWAQTRKINGKIVSNLRKQVKERLLAEQGGELEQAAIAKEAVDKYWECDSLASESR